MHNLFTRFVRDESGATAIEYGLIAALIACVLIGSVQSLGQNIYNRLLGITTSVTNAS